MTTDRLFVILLVMLIPMTGCFGAVGDADAQDETTPVEPSTTNDVEMFTVGGVFAQTDYPEDANGKRYPHSFNTSAGEVVLVHFFDATQVSGGNIVSECADGSTGYGEPYYSHDGEYLWGSHTDCVHKVRLSSPSNTYTTFAFSLVYEIQEATVLQPNSDSN